MFSFGGAKMHEYRTNPPDDPPLPSKTKCSFCKKKKDADAKIFRCTRCKVTRYCSRECQQQHWKKHKKKCKLWKDQLPNPGIRVKRNFRGAVVEHGDKLVPSEITTNKGIVPCSCDDDADCDAIQVKGNLDVQGIYTKIKDFPKFERNESPSITLQLDESEGVASHWRFVLPEGDDFVSSYDASFRKEDASLGFKLPQKIYGAWRSGGESVYLQIAAVRSHKQKCRCEESGRPCHLKCCHKCVKENDMNFIEVTKNGELHQVELSDCAKDHYSIVKNLTEKQLNAKYKKACIERWGTEHKGNEYVHLKELLSDDSYEDCSDCGADGGAWFSFCMNRPVNDDRVHHCANCGKCDYFRPGFLGACKYCGYNDDPDYGFTPENPDPYEAQMAAEGYWGY